MLLNSDIVDLLLNTKLGERKKEQARRNPGLGLSVNLVKIPWDYPSMLVLERLLKTIG